MATSMPVFAFLGNIGWTEWLLIFLAGVLLFGKRLPEVGRNLGRSLVEFKRGLSDVQKEITDAADPTKPAAPAAKNVTVPPPPPPAPGPVADPPAPPPGPEQGSGPGPA